MEAIVERCCGLDVHQSTVVACLLIGPADKRPRKQVRTFSAMTDDLLKLRDWLQQEQCTVVAMESTGVYWMPVYTVLEDAAFELVVGNASHIKNVPGRKTDVNDAEWIAKLARHGLIRKSFVPPKPLRELRELLRCRRQLVETQTAERNRLLKLLEVGNIKLASVASDVFGVSGRAMLQALVDGTSTPAAMAELARANLRKKIPLLARALDGRFDDHRRCLLKLQLKRLAATEADISQVEGWIDEKLEPYRAQHTRLMQIPGVDWAGAAVIIAELGVDMSVFPSARHAAAWAGLCPGNNESAGKRGYASTRRGNVHLKTALVQAAVCAARKKGSYLKEKYWRLKGRVGGKRAAVAIAHKILVIAYQILATEGPYADLGEAYLDTLNQGRIASALIGRLRRMGLNVVVQPAPANSTV
jgi:transposase